MENTKDVVSNEFIFTDEQQEVVCGHFGVNRDELEFWQVCELLDKVIDQLYEFKA